MVNHLHGNRACYFLLLFCYRGNLFKAGGSYWLSGCVCRIYWPLITQIFTDYKKVSRGEFGGSGVWVVDEGK